MKSVNRRKDHAFASLDWRDDRAVGFTIVEVLIVLAIAGLILLIIFLAVPAAQRSVRNHNRKAAADYIVAEMDTYKADHGYYPIEAPVPDVDDRVSFVNSLTASGPTKGYRIRYTDDGPNHSYPYAGPDAPADPMDTLDEISITPGHLCVHDEGG
jgi:prepilin-type N-terminal cleavage/methylation domain-containing protein